MLLSNLRQLAVLTVALLPFAAQSQGWPQYAGNSQHTAVSQVPSQVMQRIQWSAPVDLNPQYSGNGDLYIHYGSPVVTPANNVAFPVKTGQYNGFRVECRRVSDGLLLYKMVTDYTVPGEGWVPSCGIALTPTGSLVVPGAGGTVYIKANADSPGSAVTQVAFYGINNYNADKNTYNANVQICTPITCDNNGNLYFGFNANGATSANLVSGYARIGADGSGSWISAANAAGDSNVSRSTANCAPALSNDGNTVYVGAWMPGEQGYLLGLDSATLSPLYKQLCNDPVSGQPGWMSNDGTASPMVGPDGDVYFGILERGSNHNFRGYLLHFDATLTTVKTPGAFGWDDTASVVQAALVPSYQGSSSYLVLTKYNNYVGIGNGDGHNRVGILDPNDTETDPVNGQIQVMKEIITVLGVTPDGNGNGGAVREWCINSAAIDPFNRCAIINSEDGHNYKWDFVSNTLTENMSLNSPTGEAYTPTVIANDGTMFAINNAHLYAVGRNRISNFSVNPDTVVGGGSSTGTVTLTGPAPAGGLPVTLTSGSSVVHVPATMTVAAGAMSGTFTITTAPVGATVTRYIYASQDGITKTAGITVQVPGLKSFTISPNSVIGGLTTTGTVTLNGVAGGSRTVTLTDNSSAISVPSSVTVVAGSASAQFPIQTFAVGTVAVRTVTATLDSTTITTPLTLTPGTVLVGFTVNPSTVKGGNPVTGTVTLNQRAPTGGVTVVLSTSSAALMPPATVFIPAGVSSVNFTINTGKVSFVAVRQVTANYNHAITANITLTP